MYNIKALEEEWRRYKRKQRRPLLITTILVLAIALAGGVGYYQNFKLETLIDYIGKYTSGYSSKEENRSLVFKPYLDQPKETPLKHPKEELTVDNPLVVQPVLERVEKKPKKKLHIEVIDSNGAAAYKEVAKRFRLGHDPDDSLFLAKYFYAKRNYKKAEYWALQTNKINDNIEESWLIFAKAKAKRGYRNEAKRILKAYIKKTNSTEAKVLLDKIQKGRRF